MMDARELHAHRAVVCSAFILSFACSAGAYAQTNCTAVPTQCSPASGPLTISITIGRAVHFAISPGNTALTAPTAASYDAGFVETNGPTATVRANAPWSLSISAAASTWTAVNTQTEPARTNKPASDLQWATTLGGPFTDLAMTPASVASGPRTTGTAVTLFYRTKYGWMLDTPGNYALRIVFSITSP
jgi:hypothetical protein